MPALVVLASCLTGSTLGQLASAQFIKTAQVLAPDPRNAPPQSVGARRAGHSAVAFAQPAADRVPEPITAGVSRLDPQADLAALDAAVAESQRNGAATAAAAPEAQSGSPQTSGSVAMDSSASRSPGVLDGRTVACQAAACWPLAKLLEQRAATLLADASHCSEAEQRSAALQASFLRRQAARQRDIAAAGALRAYYSWIANRDQLALVTAGLELQKEQAATQAALIERGVAVDDPTALERKRLELRDNEVQLLANDRRLAQTLLQLTCCASDLRRVTVETLEIRPSELACDQLVTLALEHRQDYLALVELCRCLDQQSARSIASLLTPLVGGVGLKALDLNCLEKLMLAAHGGDAAGQIGRELRLAVDMQRRLVEQTTCEKCLALTTAYERIEIARQILATWEERIAMLNRLDQLGQSRGQDLITARGEQLKARSKLLERELAAKLAEVDLAEAMGDLAQRCCRGEPWLMTGN